MGLAVAESFVWYRVELRWFVDASRKRYEKIENFRRLFDRKPGFFCSLYKVDLFFLHDIGLFFAHRLPEQIGLPEGISADQFRNFEERGQRFHAAVEALPSAEGVR